MILDILPIIIAHAPKVILPLVKQRKTVEAEKIVSILKSEKEIM